VTVSVIPVEGMHCGGCERRLREALEALPGVERATPEHIGDDVEVVYDDRVTSMAELRAAVAVAGFTVR
jgi:copper chaperone CopZ